MGRGSWRRGVMCACREENKGNGEGCFQATNGWGSSGEVRSNVLLIKRLGHIYLARGSPCGAHQCLTPTWLCAARASRWLAFPCLPLPCPSARGCSRDVSSVEGVAWHESARKKGGAYRGGLIKLCLARPILIV